jgi:hypothetical protein
MDERKGVWKEGRENGRKEGRMEGMEERRKKVRTGYLVSGLFHRLVFQTSTNSKFLPFRVLILILPQVKKNLWSYILSSACKEPELPLASLLHDEGHRSDFQNFSHANPCGI